MKSLGNPFDHKSDLRHGAGCSCNTCKGSISEEAAPDTSDAMLERAVESAVVRSMFGGNDLSRRSFMGMVGGGTFAAALASVFLRFDPDQVAQTDLMDRLQALLATQDWSHAKVPPPKRVWTVPVNFDAEFAPQLAEVAGILNTTETQVIKQITSAEPRVLAIGFAPGQPYLGLLPEEWNFPRLPELSPKVPAGALLAAVRQLVLFTNENATGWRQIGQSAFRPFQPSSSDPFPLHPGDAVRFTAETRPLPRPVRPWCFTTKIVS